MRRAGPGASCHLEAVSSLLSHLRTTALLTYNFNFISLAFHRSAIRPFIDVVTWIRLLEIISVVTVEIFGETDLPVPHNVELAQLKFAVDQPL